MNVLVTGATSGIGRALAKQLVVAGGRVWGVARRAEPLAALRAELGERFRSTSLDLAEAGAADAIAGTMEAAGFVPDAVVLNAGIYPHDTDHEFDAGVASRVIAVNLSGGLALVGRLLPQVRARRGQFVAVSSLFALRPDPRGAGYAASKAALTMAFRSLAIRYRGTVQFKTILLGPIVPEGQEPGKRRPPGAGLYLRDPDRAAAAIRRLLAERRTLVTYPWPIAWALRATAWVPDAAFDALTRPFRR